MFASTVTPSSSAARAYPTGTCDGSTLQSVGLYVIARIPRSSSTGHIARASDGLMKSSGTLSVFARATSRSNCSTCSGFRAIFSAPLWANRSGWPVSASNPSSFSTERFASRVSVSVERTWLVSPAALGEVCDPGSKRSSRTTLRMPSFAR